MPKPATNASGLGIWRLPPLHPFMLSEISDLLEEQIPYKDLHTKISLNEPHV
jgi:hypothetical protein